MFYIRLEECQKNTTKRIPSKPHKKRSHQEIEELIILVGMEGQKGGRVCVVNL
jgi:hypothetical protein